jgi:hypothetical protein
VRSIKTVHEVKRLDVAYWPTSGPVRTIWLRSEAATV